MAVTIPGISCFVCFHLCFCKDNNAIAFNRRKYCHFVYCLQMIFSIEALFKWRLHMRFAVTASASFGGLTINNSISVTSHVEAEAGYNPRLL
jgi:hypothetical protein